MSARPRSHASQQGRVRRQRARELHRRKSGVVDPQLLVVRFYESVEEQPRADRILEREAVSPPSAHDNDIVAFPEGSRDGAEVQERGYQDALGSAGAVQGAGPVRRAHDQTLAADAIR